MGVSEERLSIPALALYRWLDGNTLCSQAFYENLGVGIAGIRQDGSLAGDGEQLCSDFFSVLYGGCLRGNTPRCRAENPPRRRLVINILLCRARVGFG